MRQLVREGEPVVAFDLRVDERRPALLLDAEELEAIAWVTGDVADPAAVGRALDEHGVGAVIHLAALQVPFCRADPPSGARVNVLGTVNLLQALAERRDRVGPFVYASSVAAANRAGGLHPETVYGVYKRACEGVAEVYLRESGIASIGLRPHTVFGPGRDQGLTSAPTQAMLAAAAGRAYEIPFTGRLTMQYAPDVAAAFVAASRLDGYANAEVFDLPGDTVDVAAVLAAIEAVAPAAEIACAGPPLPFPPEVAAREDAPFAAAVSLTPLRDGIGDAVGRFSELLARGLVEAPGGAAQGARGEVRS
jgi:UDP-glucuronate 4-epimerase